MLILWVLYCILCKNAKNVTRLIDLNKWLIGSKNFVSAMLTVQVWKLSMQIKVIFNNQIFFYFLLFILSLAYVGNKSGIHACINNAILIDMALYQWVLYPIQLSFRCLNIFHLKTAFNVTM